VNGIVSSIAESRIIARRAVKTLYCALPYKQPMFDVVRRFWAPPRWLSSRLRFEGVISVPVGGHGDLKLVHRGYSIENGLYWSGLEGWEKESLKLWLALSEGAKRVLDVGANTGLYALLAKRVAPDAVVDAFEPLEESYRVLVENSKLNNFAIRAHRLALSSHDGKARFYVKPGSTYDASLERDFRHLSDDSSVEVTVRKGDSFCAEYPDPEVDLVKIDTESHEAEVIDGMRETITSSHPAMLVELIREGVAERVWNIVGPMGYRCFMVDEKTGPREVDRPSRTHVGKSGEVYNFLFARRETHLGIVERARLER